MQPSASALFLRSFNPFAIADVLQLWNASLVEGSQPLAVFNGTGSVKDRIKCVAVSHDGSVVVGGTLSNDILVYQIAPPNPTAFRVLKGHSNEVMKIRFGPPGTPVASSLFSCSRDFKLRRWNIGTAMCEFVYEGNTILTSGSTGILDIGKRGHYADVCDFAISPDGRYFCAVGYKGLLGTDRDSTKLWDVQSGKCLKNYQGHTEHVSAVVASPDGLRFYSAGNDKTIRAWLGNPDIRSQEHKQLKEESHYRVQMFRQTVIIFIDEYFFCYLRIV